MRSFVAPESYEATDFLIRAYRPGDGGALARAIVDSYEHLRPWMVWATLNQPAEEGEAKVREFVAKYWQNQEFILGIWRGAEFLGGTGFHLRWGDIDSGNIEIGMWISQAHAGKGLGTGVLQSMLAWGFTSWPWQRVVWKCDADNVASARVAEKCGLVLEGTFQGDGINARGHRRDTHVYACLRNEWLAANAAAIE